MGLEHQIRRDTELQSTRHLKLQQTADLGEGSELDDGQE